MFGSEKVEVGWGYGWWKVSGHGRVEGEERTWKGSSVG